MFYLIAVVITVFSCLFPAFSQEDQVVQENRENKSIESLISEFETHLHFYYLLSLGSLHETYVISKISVRKDIYIHRAIFLAKEIGSREFEYRKELPATYNFFRNFGSFHSICRKLIFNNTEFDAEHKAYCSGRSGSNQRGYSNYGSNNNYDTGCTMAESPRNYSLVNYYSSRRKSEKRFKKYLENIQTMYAYKRRVEEDLRMLRDAVEKKRIQSAP